MPLREVKNRLSEVVDRVAGQHDRVVITRHVTTCGGGAQSR